MAIQNFLNRDRFRQIIYKISTVFFSFLIIVVVIQLFSSSVVESSQCDIGIEDSTKTLATYAIEIPKEVFFANERVPIAYFDVRESLDREMLVNTYWQSQTMLFFKRANRFFPIIEPILKQNNIPDDFKYLALAESGLDNVVSPSGAKGYWQFLTNTAKEYGLEVNEFVDERYHIEKSTQAACDYLNDAYKKYNNWAMAAASYNMGMSGLNKQIKRQKINNYYDLILNTETARYVFRIIALKIIMENPSKYGFSFSAEDLYQPIETYTVAVDSTLEDLADFAFHYQINYKILKLFNPWLRDNTLPNKTGKKYDISIPVKIDREFIFPAQIDTVNADTLLMD